MSASPPAADKDEPVDNLTSSIPKLRIDDAFDSHDINDDDDLQEFDLKAIVGRALQEVVQQDDDPALGDRNRRSPASDFGSSYAVRSGRAIPPALMIVTAASVPALPQLEVDEVQIHGHFENVSLSPPTSPATTTSLSINQVPVPVPSSPLKSPSSTNVSSMSMAMRSVTSLSLEPSSVALRSVSPRPHYLSPLSTVPTPTSVDPIPHRVPSPPPSSKRHSSEPFSLRQLGGTRSIPGDHTGSTTSAALAEKLLSRTRPAHLPPKPRSEDLKHQREFEEMMKRSRALEIERLENEKRKALEREGRAEDATAVWEREIMPDWRRVLRSGKDKDADRLRNMWWGGIPGKLRGRLWAAVVGNGLALSKETFRTCSSRAKRALSSGSFPAETLFQIEADIRNTLPNLHIFHPEYGPMYQDLKDLLCAWVVSRADEGLGYVRGTSNIAAMFVLNMSLDQAFMSMRNLLERHCLRSFFGGEGSDDDLEAYYRIFDTLLADGMPKVYFNFKQHQISPSLYLPSWIVPLFLTHLPFEMVAIAVLGILESRLFFPERKELLEVLRGENKAALEVARRTGLSVDLTARYEQYGMSEQALWDRIAEMDEWWRETTWSRLITRELPDL